MACCIRCPHCDCAFEADAADPSTEVRCSACGTLLGHVADASTRVDHPADVRSIATLKGFSDPVECTAFSADGKLLAAGLGNGTIAVRDVRAWAVRGDFQAHDGQVWAVRFAPGGSLLASGGEDGLIRLWEITRHRNRRLSGTPKGAPLIGHGSPVLSLAFSPDGRTLLSGTGLRSDQGGFLTGIPRSLSLIGEARTWDAETGRECNGPLDIQGMVLSVAVSADGRSAAAAVWTETGAYLTLWDPQTGIVRWSHQPLSTSPQALVFSRDGKTLIAGYRDGTIRLWNSTAGKATGSFGVLGRNQYFLRPAVGSLAVSADGRFLAAGPRISQNNLQLFEPSTGQSRAVLQGQIWETTSVDFSPVDGILASGGEDRTIKIWQND